MRKNHKCPHCENQQVWNKGRNSETGELVWVCGLCGHEEKRTVRRSKIQKELSELIG